VLTLARRRVQVIRQARWARFGRRRVAKRRPTQPRHDVFVRHDDREIYDRHKDDEVNDCGDERPEVQVCGIATAGDQLPAESRPFDAALGRRDKRVDNIIGESLDKIAERQSHDQSDGDHDHVTAHEEIPEALQHVNSSHLPDPTGEPARCVSVIAPRQHQAFHAIFGVNNRIGRTPNIIMNFGSVGGGQTRQ